MDIIEEKITQHPRTWVPFGAYDLFEMIAHGGMAEVYLGVKRETQTPVVIKRILPSLASDEQFVAMFINEAQLAAQMNHPNIVRVFDFGEQEGRLYMAMEYVNGLDCWRFARRLHPWGSDHASIVGWIISEVLCALEYVHSFEDVNGHSLNVVHRDLSPSNIYLSRDGDVKLGDFGIARVESQRYRQVSMIPKGKFGYVAPEQVEGLSIDCRADIFSVGIVMAELLMGKKMFVGPSQLSVMLEIKDGRLDTLRQNTDSIEPGLVDILHSALARSPDDRFESATVFKNALTDHFKQKGRLASAQLLGAQVNNAVRLRNTQIPLDEQITSETPLVAESIGPYPNTPSETEVTRVNPETPITIDSGEYGTPITSEDIPAMKEWRYRARLADGRTIGPTSYAHIIELICTDQIGPQTLVSTRDTQFFPASHFVELARHLPNYTPTCDVDKIETPQRRGALHVAPPASIILNLAASNETGMLVCRQFDKRKEVYFREGTPIYVTSNTPDELLGEFLVAHAVIDRPDLEIALSLLPKFNGHLGDTFIALGMLSAVDLFNNISLQINERFIDLISWRRGYYDFYPDTSCRTDVLEVAIDPFKSIPPLLISAAKEITPPKIIEVMVGRSIDVSPLYEMLLTKMALPPEMENHVSRFTADRIIEIETQSISEPAASAIVSQAIYLAVEAGIWSLDGPILPWREPV